MCAKPPGKDGPGQSEISDSVAERHPDQIEGLSIDRLKSLEWDIRHEQARRSVEYAVATATHWAIDDEAHRRGSCLGSGICTALEHGEQGALHRWRQEANRHEWRCSRCHLWLIGLLKSGKRVYEALYLDADFSPYVSALVKGGRDLLFSDCNPAESRRLLAAAAREHQTSQARREQQPIEA